MNIPFLQHHCQRNSLQPCVQALKMRLHFPSAAGRERRSGSGRRGGVRNISEVDFTDPPKDGGAQGNQSLLCNAGGPPQ